MLKNGFSLIELSVVLFIVALLASFAYPSYQQFVIKSRRIDGQTALLKLATQMEIYYSQHHSYLGATIGSGKITDVADSNQSPDHCYQLSIKEQSENTYTLEARALGKQALEDITLNHLGNLVFSPI